MRILKFSVTAIAKQLRDIHADMHRTLSRADVRDSDGIAGVDVRLTLLKSGGWYVTSGDVSYDTSMSHAVGFVPWGRFNSRDLARALLNEAADFLADDPEWEDIAIEYASATKGGTK